MCVCVCVCVRARMRVGARACMYVCMWHHLISVVICGLLCSAVDCDSTHYVPRCAPGDLQLCYVELKMSNDRWLLVLYECVRKSIANCNLLHWPSGWIGSARAFTTVVTYFLLYYRNVTLASVFISL